VYVLWLLSCLSVRAAVDPAVTIVPKDSAWVGQRVEFYVELRARGLFVGTASFELPQIPRTLLIKIGEPVVGSKEIEDETWFTQTHEFALFSQHHGALEVPAIGVQFSRREGFTGPANAVQALSPGFTIRIARPPGSEQMGFLITTESLELTETWEPAPGPAEVGAVFKRTIVQRAPQLLGMAFAPAPTETPEGLRAYVGDATTRDDLTRGEFRCERRETITYLVQDSGTLELPALRYVWWNPKASRLESKTLPAVTFEVAAPPAPAAAVAEPDPVRPAWLVPALVLMTVLAAIVLGSRAVRWVGGQWRRLNPPERVAARRLLRACRRNDAAAAQSAWSAWRASQVVDFRRATELYAAVVSMQRYRYGPDSTTAWSGDELARSFVAYSAASVPDDSTEAASGLPSLNPRG
jgi:hypothetical protein